MKKMKYLKQYLNFPIVYFFIMGLLFLTNIGTVSYFLLTKEECPVCLECPVVEEIVLDEEEKEEVTLKKIVVDIKGYVKNPGVYQLDEGALVNDLVNLAGGLKYGGTTDYINLSKKLVNEDCIKIIAKPEVKQQTSEVLVPPVEDNCVTNNVEEVKPSNQKEEVVQNKKVSINKGTKEELMTLTGIGEAKALSIIAYREKTPFKELTEIMKVSGIGEMLYEKIKDNITL